MQVKNKFNGSSSTNAVYKVGLLESYKRFVLILIVLIPLYMTNDCGLLIEYDVMEFTSVKSKFE